MSKLLGNLLDALDHLYDSDTTVTDLHALIFMSDVALAGTVHTPILAEAAQRLQKILSPQHAFFPIAKYEVPVNPLRSDRQYYLSFVVSCEQTIRLVWAICLMDWNGRPQHLRFLNYGKQLLLVNVVAAARNCTQA